jgi:hypothetical protein
VFFLRSSELSEKYETRNKNVLFYQIHEALEKKIKSVEFFIPLLGNTRVLNDNYSYQALMKVPRVYFLRDKIKAD